MNEGELPKMESTYTLGREWRYYKKDLDKARRIKKKADERAAERKSQYGAPRESGGDRGSGPSRSGGDRRGGIGSGGAINMPMKRNKPW